MTAGCLHCYLTAYPNTPTAVNYGVLTSNPNRSTIIVTIIIHHHPHIHLQLGDKSIGSISTYLSVNIHSIGMASLTDTELARRYVRSRNING
jgi:hypothetical protein